MSDEVYYGLTDSEAIQKSVNYKGSTEYDGKFVNMDLKGLRRFIIDNNMDKDIKKYCVIPLSNFEILSHIYKDDKYNMIAVKIPFFIKFDKTYKLF
jgi:hypothetical protein